MAVALVTGASSGIGLQYATTLAREYKYDMLLVSNQPKELQQAAEHLHTTYGVVCKWLNIDLATQDAAEKVFAFCEQENLDVEVLVNNAGFLIFDAFIHSSPAKINSLLNLHIVTLTNLCRLFGASMAKRALKEGHKWRGYILNMSSMTAWMAMPSIACYNASKGYVLNFSKALWYEYRLKGIRVLAVTPGSIDTGLLPFNETFAKILRAVGITMSPERLTHRATKVLLKGNKKRCMPGAWNYIIVPIINHLPDWLIKMVVNRLPMFSI